MGRRGALILESTFRSLPSLATSHYRAFAVPPLILDKYPTLELLARVRCPVLVAHGPHDEIVPYAHGEALFDAARTPKRFLELAGGHNDGASATGSRYVDELDEFLDEALGD